MEKMCRRLQKASSKSDNYFDIVILDQKIPFMIGLEMQ